MVLESHLLGGDGTVLKMELDPHAAVAFLQRR